MLVLSRERGQSIVIDGGRIQIFINDIRGDKVRIGIAAPRDVVVDRCEVHEQKIARAAAARDASGEA
ncbi:MAG: carbon storage regulator [Rubripirellula sp.]